MNPIRTTDQARGEAPARRPGGPRTGGLPGAPSSVLAVLVAVAAGACGNLTSGGFGEVELLVSSDAAEEVSMSASLLLAELLPAGVGVNAEELEGTLTIAVRAWVRQDTEVWLEITSGVEEVVMPLGDPTPVVLSRTELRAAEYTAVRAIFGRVRANVVRGLTVDGEPIVGEIQVDLGSAGAITIEESLDLVVAQDRSIPLVLEMRAPAWLRLADRIQRTVAEEIFRSQFRIRVRP